jgi:hypothetical protein
MMTQVGLFAALTGVPRVALRLATRAGPGWPGRASGLRLLTSYAGAGLDGLLPGAEPLPPGGVAALRDGTTFAGPGDAARLLLCLDAPRP